MVSHPKWTLSRTLPGPPALPLMAVVSSFSAELEERTKMAHVGVSDRIAFADLYGLREWTDPWQSLFLVLNLVFVVAGW